MTTRERLLAAMAEALQRRGFHGIGLNELLQQAEAPKGVLYHHFPGGKTALAVAAIEATVERICQNLDQLLGSQNDPLDGLRLWIARAERKLEESHFESGCPLATVALESTSEDQLLRQSLAKAFASVRATIEAHLERSGFAGSAGLAALIVATYEGALIQARVAGNHQPLKSAAQALLGLLEERKPHGDLPSRT